MSVQRSPRRKRKQISQNVRELHKSLGATLNDAERRSFIQTLNQYQKNRNIKWLVSSLHSILNTPEKREIYPKLRTIIPKGEQAQLDRYWQSGTRVESPQRSRNKLRGQVANSSSLPEHLDRYASLDSGVDLRGPPSSRKTSPTRQRLKEKYPLKRFYLKRNTNTGFGFSVRGGSEHGIGLYISLVDENSISEKQGLLPGDHILFVNGTRFDGLTHGQAVQFIQKHRKLDIIVRSVGRIPGTYIAETTYKWVDPKGRQVSPPPTVDSLGREIEDMHKSELRLLGDDDERKVNLFVEDGSKLGLMVRGGAEYGLGIYIAGVDDHSLADKAGLKTGEQILDVNGKSFVNITHKEAIKVLKSTKNMMFTIKDVGKLPFARTTEDKTRWLDGSHVKSDVQRRHTLTGEGKKTKVNNTHVSEQSLFHHGIAGSQLLYNGTGNLPSQKNFIEEQARQVLNENEIGTLSYYLDEYKKGSIKISAFVLALFDLLNSPAKESLLSEVRGSVLAKDLDRYDELIMQREIEAMTEIATKKLFHCNGDSDSLHSYDSTLSSYSARGSISSRSSTKESIDGDSRPITPPHIPEVLPSNVKVDYDVYEGAVIFNDETTPDSEYFGLPNFISIDSTTLSADLPAESTLTTQPGEECPPRPILISSPRKEADITTNINMTDELRTAELKIVEARTNGEVTSSCETGGNDRDQNPHSHNSAPAVENGDLLTLGKFGFEIPDEGFETKQNGSLSSTTSKKSFLPANKNISLPASDSTKTHDSSKSWDETIVNSPRSTISAPARAESLDNSVKTTSQRSPLEQSPLIPKTKYDVGVLPSMSKSEESVTLRPVQSVESATDERRPFGGSVMNKVLKFNEIVDKETSDATSTRRNSRVSSRKSWDGVEQSHSDEQKKDSHFERSRDKSRSHSDTKLVERLPKDEQRSFNIKLRASQELFELHHQSRPKKEDSPSIALQSKPTVVQKANTSSPKFVIETKDTGKTSFETIKSNKTVTSTGEFDVEIEKSSLNLGLVIEGGSDTPRGEVMVKCIKEGDYAASKCGVLRPGQTILRVNGKPLDGLPNGVAVMTIRQAYTSHDTRTLVLTIRDN